MEDIYKHVQKLRREAEKENLTDIVYDAFEAIVKAIHDIDIPYGDMKTIISKHFEAICQEMFEFIPKEKSTSDLSAGVWRKRSEKAEDDKNYLVCWKEAEDKYSIPHKAYYIEEYDRFFSLENNNAHPICVDLFMEIPKAGK